MAAAKPAGKRFSRRSIIVLSLFGMVLLGLLWDGSPLGSLILRQAVALKFRDVRQVSPAELVRWMRDPNRPPPLLVDARPDSQYAVSHIDGAVHLDPAEPDLRRLAGVSRETPIVVYDGPGVVGSAMAQALAREEYLRVSNLEGGLFRWVNEGYPVVNADGPATRVLAASWTWGRLLKARYRP